MKKFILLLLVIFINQPAFALKNNILSDLFASSDMVFIKKENVAYEKCYKNLGQQFAEVWNLQNKEFLENDTFKNDIKKNNIKNFADCFIKIDNKELDDIYKEFQENKNNIYNNKILYDNLYEDFIFYYDKLSEKYVDDIYKNGYKQYIDDFLSQFPRDWNVMCLKNDKYSCVLSYNIPNLEYLKSWEELKDKTINDKNLDVGNIYNVINEYKTKATSIAQQIQDYSIKYETNKVKNFYKSKYLNISNSGIMLEDIIVGNDVPQKNEYYDSYMPLEIVQVMPNGVIVKNSFSEWNSKYIFVLTNKNYVDKQLIQGRFLYRGIYRYKTVLGSTATIYKFEEIPYPTGEYYFINK